LNLDLNLDLTTFQKLSNLDAGSVS